MGGGGGPQTSKVELPAWLEGAAERNLGTAEKLAGQDYVPYTGQRIAGTNADQGAAGDAIRNMQGQTGTALQGLGGQSAEFGGWQPSMVNPQTLAGTDLQPYMNPFTGEVEQNALRALESSRQGAQNQQQDQFLSSKAFGGSRHALQSAVTDSMAAEKAGSLSAQLRQANFNQAQQGAIGDITRGMQAQTSNQQAGLQGAQLNLSALNQAGNLYGQGQKSNIADIGLLDTLGTQQQQRDQGALDLQYQNFLEQQGYSKQQVEWLQQMIGSAPGSQQTTVNAGGGKGSPIMGALGGAAAGAAAGSVIPVYGTAIGAVGGAILGGLSSR